jgi:dihydropteroate synthase
VPQDEEMRRVLPVVQEAVKLGVPISVDTYKPAVMQAVLDAGADIVNDIWGLRQPGAQDVVARHPSCGVCLMHMHQTPQNMHLDHMSGDPVPQVRDFLLHETQSLLQRGVQRNRIVWDYGIGFGKSVAQNFALLARQHELLELDFPLLAGWSRKGSLGTVSGLPVEQRMVPSVAAALLAVERGARVVRVHDVADTRAALSVWQAMQPPATSA